MTKLVVDRQGPVTVLTLGLFPLSLCTLTNPYTPLWLTLSVWHLKNTVPLLLLSGLLLLRLGHHLTLPLVARHLSKKR